LQFLKGDFIVLQGVRENGVLDLINIQKLLHDERFGVEKAHGVDFELGAQSLSIKVTARNSYEGCALLLPQLSEVSSFVT